MHFISPELKNLALNSSILLTVHLILYSQSSYALYGFINQNQWEASIMPITYKMPSIDNGDDLSGARLAATNYFYNYKKMLELGLDASVTYLESNTKQTKPDYSKSITILSPAFTARWYPTNFKFFSPFVAAGVGPSYMTNNDLGGRSLGMRFAFQDFGGIGIKTTGDNQFIFGVYIIHYSNASLHNNNRGITLPFSAKLAFRF